MAIVSSIYGIFMLPLFTTQSLSCDGACAAWIAHKTEEQESRRESGVVDVLTEEARESLHSSSLVDCITVYEF